MGSGGFGTQAGWVRERAVKWLGQFAPSVIMHFGVPKCMGGSLCPAAGLPEWEVWSLGCAQDLERGARIGASEGFLIAMGARAAPIKKLTP